MTRQRNEQATCGTCAYWRRYTEGEELPRREEIYDGYCRVDAIKSGPSKEDYWCGEHPEFWLEEECRVDSPEGLKRKWASVEEPEDDPQP